MKTLTVLLIMGAISFGTVFANNNDPILKKEITKKVTIDLKQEGVDFSCKDFVKVSFKIYEGEIQILEMNATQVALKELVERELEEMKITSPYGFNQTYYYKFTFVLE